MMFVIGLGCTAGVGKDTAALYLAQHYRGVHQVAYADKLKLTCMLVWGLSEEQCYGSIEVKETVDPRYGVTPREIMQDVGLAMRGIRSSIWVDSVYNATIPSLQLKGFDIFVISDVRYLNDAEAVHRVGGKVVNIVRPKAASSVGGQHESENALLHYEGFDNVVVNTGSLEEYYAQLDALMETYGYADRKVG